MAGCAAAGVLALAGAGPGISAGHAATAAAAIAGNVTLTYTCQFPGGERSLTAQFAATLPDQGVVGQEIHLAEPSVTVTFPESVISDLAVLGGTTVGGNVRVTTAVTRSGDATEVAWPDLNFPFEPLPASGELTRVATGAVTPVVPIEPGEVVIAAGDITVDLTPLKEDGSATDPVVVTAACRLDPDQVTTLATVPVVSATVPSDEVPEASPEISPGISAVAQREYPPECGQIPIPPRGRVAGCTLMAGYTNVNKLNASVRVEPALTNVVVMRPTFQFPYLRAANPAELVGGVMPPMTGQFLSFGFMPVEATMELSQVGPMTVYTDGLAIVPFTYTVRVVSQLSARVTQVKINGVSLEVGQNCRTERPIDTVLSGGTPQYQNILNGGPLSGTIEIPPFSGCGVTEDLDPLFTGTISGPNNYVKVKQGNICAPTDLFTRCPPEVPQLPPPNEF